MDEMDDFGDLYADVEVHVNAGIESTNRLYIGGDMNTSDGNLKGAFHLNSQEEDSELDSDREELVLDDQICKTNGDPEKPNGEGSKMPCSGAECGNMNVEDGSESEDDLHIVLNEDDCQVYPVSRGTGVGNGGRAGRSEDEDDDDNLVIVTEADRPSKDRRHMDGLEHGTGGAGAERGNTSMGTYASQTQYSQFKYVRPHAAALPSNLKASGSVRVVSSPLPVCGRSDWDVDGGNQMTVLCSGLDTSAYNLGIHAASQKRFDFHLPRNRTIFDVNIETFEWKPWRHPGVDTTDYFNFGFDEESWKSYCKNLEHFRQQNTMLTKIPVYQSSRPNQACEDAFLQRTVAYEALGGEIAQTDHGDRVSLSENICRTARTFEMPKGRAIQVEGGIGERLPSIDLRRPRYRDSDVVIQIPMQDATEESSVSNGKEPEHVDESSANIRENGGLILEDSQSKQHLGALHGVLVGHHHQKVIEPVSKETDEELETIKGRDTENMSQVGKATLDADSASCDQIQCNLSPSNLRNHSEASKAGVSVGMDKHHNHKKRLSSSSLTESAHRQSTDTRSDNSKTEHKDKDSSPDQSLIQDERSNSGRLRLCSMAWSKIPTNDTKASTPADGKGWYNGDHQRQGTRKGRQDSYDSDENDSIENECYYRETEISIGHRDRGFVENQERRDSYTEHVRRKNEPRFREEKGPYLRRDRDEGECYVERFTARADEMEQREYYFPERGRCSDDGVSVHTQKECGFLISENATFHRVNKKYMQLRRKNETDYQCCKLAENDDFVFEHRYKEESIREKYVRHTLYYGTEDDLVQERYGRCGLVCNREKVKSDRRERDALSPSLGLDGSWRAVEYNGRRRRNPDDNPLFSEIYREVNNEDGKWWHDSNPSRNHACNSWRPNIKYEDHNRSNERCTDQWRPNGRYSHHWRMPDLRDKQSNKRREESHIFVRGKEHRYRSCYRKDVDFDDDSCHAGEVAVFPNSDICDERKRYRCHWNDEEPSFGHEELDGSDGPVLDRGSRYEDSHLGNDSAHNRKHLDDFWLRSRKKISEGKSLHSKASKFTRSASDIADWGKCESTALRCKETVDLHLNDWERKHLQRCSEAEVRRSRYDNAAYADNGEWTARRKSDEVTTSKAASARMLKVKNNLPHGISSKVERAGHCSLEHSADINNEKWVDKFPIVKHEGDMELEEGQLPEEPEPENKEGFNQSSEQVFEKTAPSKSVELSQHEDTVVKPKSTGAANDNKDGRGFDNNRILEMLAKMERRRERFKEPIALKNVPDKSLQVQAQSNVVVETLKVKQQRPARKRRWGAL